MRGCRGEGPESLCHEKSSTPGFRGKGQIVNSWTVAGDYDRLTRPNTARYAWKLAQTPEATWSSEGFRTVPADNITVDMFLVIHMFPLFLLFLLKCQE
jgi:hypothetical protein